MTTFNEAQHPRKSEGTSQGGQFTNVITSASQRALNGRYADTAGL